MESVLQPELAIAMAATLVAGIVRGFSGFGAAMVQVPIFAILYSAPQAVGTTAALGVLACLQLLPGSIRETGWREVAPLTVLAVLALPLGSLVLLTLDADLMRRIISGVVLAMTLVLMSGWRYPDPPGARGTCTAGILSGLLNGATGVGGPVVVLYLLAGPNPAANNRANLIVFFLFVNGGTALSLFAHGVFTLETLWRTLAIWPAQIVALGLGSFLFRHATDRIYRRIALALLMGIAMLGLLYTR